MSNRITGVIYSQYLLLWTNDKHFLLFFLQKLSFMSKKDNKSRVLSSFMSNFTPIIYEQNG